MVADRLLYPVEAWRQWYADVTTAAPELSPADVLARWEATAAPSYQILGFPPSAADQAEAPLHTYLLRDGTWWVRDRDATSMTPRPGISWDAAGPFLRTPDGQIIRSRERVAEHFSPIADDDLIVALIGGFPTARNQGSRKPSGARILARALVCLSLRDGGMPGLTAVRTWLAWECAMGPGEADAWYCLPLSRGRGADPVDRQSLKDHLRHLKAHNLTIWRVVGLTE